MKIIRAGLDDTDIFSIEELAFGACCFYTEDRAFRYFFTIQGRVATLFSEDKQYREQVIDEFLFYSGFIQSIQDKDGQLLRTRNAKELFLHEIAEIQPSQFYINERKLNSCKSWIKCPKDILIPVVVKNGITISLDGHTRLQAAYDLGYKAVYVYCDDYDELVFRFADEARKRKIFCVSDMEIVSDEDYHLKWDQYCDELLAGL